MVVGVKQFLEGVTRTFVLLCQNLLDIEVCEVVGSTRCTLGVIIDVVVSRAHAKVEGLFYFEVQRRLLLIFSHYATANTGLKEETVCTVRLLV